MQPHEVAALTLAALTLSLLDSADVGEDTT